MTDKQRKRVHDITYSCDDRAELAERIVALEDENAKLKNNNNYLHEMLSDSRQANEHLYAELKHHKSILRTRPNAMTALYDENAKMRELVLCLLTCASDSDDACDKCPVNGGSGIWDFADFCDSLLDRVHELGIEADA